jgi:hypothetical protein
MPTPVIAFPSPAQPLFIPADADEDPRGQPLRAR